MTVELYKDLPGYAKLDEKQKKIVDGWDQERILQDKVFSQLDEALNTQNEKLYQEALASLGEVSKSAYMCAHERHWSSRCMACDAIEKILRPELYCQGKNCDYQLEPEEVEAGETLCEICKDKE